MNSLEGSDNYNYLVVIGLVSQALQKKCALVLLSLHTSGAFPLFLLFSPLLFSLARYLVIIFFDFLGYKRFGQALIEKLCTISSL